MTYKHTDTDTRAHRQTDTHTHTHTYTKNKHIHTRLLCMGYIVQSLDVQETQGEELRDMYGVAQTRNLVEKAPATYKSELQC